MKLFYFDTETTGTDPVKHDIVSLACIVEINSEVLARKCWYIRPFDFSTVEQGALDANGFTMQDLMGFQDPNEAYKEIVSFLGNFIDKYDSNDKFTPVGHNAGFDTNMLRSFFKKNKDNYYGSWFVPWDVDTMRIASALRSAGLNLNIPNMKLGTLCARFGIYIKAHDAISDTEAMRQVYLYLRTLFFNHSYIQQFNKESFSWAQNM